MQVAFYKGKSRFFNRLCSFWLRGLYSHCEVILGYDASGAAICASSSMMDSGVRVKHIALKAENWDVIDTAGDVDSAWAWLAQHEGAKYDYLGLIGFIARIFGHSKKRFLCSEAAAEMMGFVDAWRFDPCSLYAALTRRGIKFDESQK